ncbi:hypothetical protein D3C76_1328190 [compost metagenome]
MSKLLNRLLEYLPELYHDVFDFKEFTETESTELLGLQQVMDQLLDDRFVDTASEQAIKRRESMLGIQADPTTETLDFRRKRLVNRYSTKPPFTFRYLQQRLDYLVGSRRAIASVYELNFILTVTMGIDDAALFREVQLTIHSMIPANLVYLQRTSIMDRISLREGIRSKTLTRQTRLSTNWRLGSTPFSVIEPEVVVK